MCRWQKGGLIVIGVIAYLAVLSVAASELRPVEVRVRNAAAFFSESIQRGDEGDIKKAYDQLQALAQELIIRGKLRQAADVDALLERFQKRTVSPSVEKEPIGWLGYFASFFGF